MSEHPRNIPSFSARHRWKITIDVAIRTVLVLAIVVMVNYLSTLFFHRFYLSHQRNGGLNPITLAVLHSLTNHISVTLFYDRHDDFFPDITHLLDEYHGVNHNITYTAVDYNRDPGKAEAVRQKYQLNSPKAKNLFIFECEGRVKVGSGEQLLDYRQKGFNADKKLEIGPVAFRGEQLFTGMILALESPQPLKAYFLHNDGEPLVSDTSDFGYQTFASILAQNYIASTNLQISPGDEIPMDCALLVVAGPVSEGSAIPDYELEAIDKYLSEGGRMFASFSYRWIQPASGLEPILKRWGVNVAADVVRDLKNSSTKSGEDVIVTEFVDHPIVSPLAGSKLQMIFPRPVESLVSSTTPPGAPSVTELAYTGPESTLTADATEPARRYPVMAAIEQKPVAGAAGARGNTRIVVTGDSLFLANLPIQYAANREFLGYAINWLVDKPQLLQKIGAHPLTEYRLNLSVSQQSQARWLLLAALPGIVLLFGGIVWYVRRK
jgi:ABC-type uncharacterized transport system involved in gliding motility auxiliary subunit